MSDDSIDDEGRRFAKLQQRLPGLFQRVFPDRLQPRSVLVVPSLSLDRDVLSRISGVHHYEERMLCMLLLLRMPRTHLIYVTSEPVEPAIIDYYLHLLPGIPTAHARSRLTLLSCHDSSPRPLTAKILERPRVLGRIRQAIPDTAAAHMNCFNATELERRLALELDVPLYGCDPALLQLGSKSGGREVFRNAGVPMPEGFENLSEEWEIVQALAELKRRQPDLSRAVVKLNEGFSGEGNSVFSFQGSPAAGGLESWIAEQLPTRLRFEAKGETWEHFAEKFAQMGGIVEAWIDAQTVRSPSVQCRIDPLGEIALISTHDQVLGGPSGQIFLGCSFPADGEYRSEIQRLGLRAAEELRRHDVIGRFGVDFISVRDGDTWNHYAIEINLRKGGTTHPFLMLQFLTDGHYDPETGDYLTPAGQKRYYYASDNLRRSEYRGLAAEDLIDIAVCRELHFHGATQQGVVFHLLGALSEFGKLGVMCISGSRRTARRLYDQAVEVLDEEVVKAATRGGASDPHY